MREFELQELLQERPARGRAAEFWCWLLLALQLFGYPIAALMSTASLGPHDVLTYGYRLAIAGLSTMLILVNIRDKVWVKYNIWLAFFSVVYIVRLLWDWLIADFRAPVTPFYALMYFVGTVMLPGMACGYSRLIENDERTTAQRLAIVGTIVCGFIVLFQLMGWGSDKTLSLVQTGGRYQLEALNPISMGHVAVSTLICLLVMTVHRPRVIGKVLLVGAAFIAVGCLAVSGSRGPMVALILSLIAYAVLTRRVIWGFLSGILIFYQLLNEDSVVMKRLATLGKDASAQGRLGLQESALGQFAESPFFGNAFLEETTREYPHNLIVETAMALGIVGLLILALILYHVYKCCRRDLKMGHYLFVLLFLQYFIGGQFSGAIWGAMHLSAIVATLCSPRPDSPLPLDDEFDHQDEFQPV